jgi:SAM domain (Sterile alpha motif)
MQQVADWLEKLGMSEYAKPFAENRIDFSVLPDLTDQDLDSWAFFSVIGAKCCVRSPTSTTRGQRLLARRHRHLP